MENMAAVAEWYRFRIVTYLVTSSSPVPLKTHRVGQRCPLNLSRAETSSRWCGVVVRRGGASSGVTARGGRVRSTTPAEDRDISSYQQKRNRRTTAQQVANQFLVASGKQISRKTVARRLRGGGLYARRPVVCVPLTRQHRTARL
ncbi:uncharacterized protein TNCV_3787951 [Trichonephila clavipes]|nr:uncharacterized protein TNCV_3787951 [Trichonephila clavipes]